MKFTIDRSKWRCGGDQDGRNAHGIGSTMLLNPEGYMCCLGFVSIQCGIPSNNIYRTPSPCFINNQDGVFTPGDFILVKEGYDNTTLAEDAMTVNDLPRIDAQVREQRLIQIFAQHGHELEFVGEFEK